MSIRRPLFLAYLILFVTAYVLVAILWVMPWFAGYYVLASGHAAIRRVKVVEANLLYQSGAGSGRGVYMWHLRLTGGPLHSLQERIEVDPIALDSMGGRQIFASKMGMPVVRLGRIWLPTSQIRLDALWEPGLLVAGMAILALILRGYFGPRAFPSGYEPVIREIRYGSVPTLGYGLILVLVFLGASTLCLNMSFLRRSCLHPDVVWPYWIGLAFSAIFVLAGPLLIWASLPKFLRTGYGNSGHRLEAKIRKQSDGELP